MLSRIFNRKGRYLNCWIVILSLTILVLSIIQIDKPTENINLSIFSLAPLFFGVMGLIIGIIGTIFCIIYITLNFFNKECKDNRQIFITKKIIFYVLIITTSIFFLEHIILGLIRTFIEASGFNQIPTKDKFWTSVAWLLINNWQDFGSGILVTLGISLLGTIIGLILGLLLAILRVQKVNKKDSEFKAFIKKIGVYFSKGYIGLFRGTPMMVQAILLYYLVPFAISQATGVPMSTMNKIFTWFVSGLITVSLNTTAYLAEVLRGGIEAIDKGQMEAARSLGLSYWKTMLFVILPQALKNSMPSIGNEFVINIKDTSVLNVISVIDVYFVASQIQSQYYRFNEPFFIAACIYLCLTFCTTRILGFIDKKMDIAEKPLPSSN